MISFDFAVAILPGWHSTVFPPYFVIGAVFSGLAMVTILTLTARWAFGLKAHISTDHLERVGKVLLFCSWVIGIVYAGEIFHSHYQGDPFDLRVTDDRLSGPMALPYLVVLMGNVLIPQLLWWRRCRRSTVVMVAVSISILLGMWMERFVIIVGSLYRDFLPSSWTSYLPTSIEVVTLIGGFGLFFSGYLLFVRVLPIVPISETKSLLRARIGEPARPRRRER